MAGPVPSYLSTQVAAQTAFTVPFGLLTLVNSAITAATAAGQFNVTVDCSLFTADDVSNLRIYLDSLGYKVQFAKNTNNKALNIDWGAFFDAPGTTVVAIQGTIPWIVSGTVTIALSPTAITTAVVVTTSPTPLLAANLSRKGFIVQNTSGVVFVKFDSTCSTALYGYELPRKAILEKDNYSGDVTAVTAAGSVTVYVTELV